MASSRQYGVLEFVLSTSSIARFFDRSFESIITRLGANPVAIQIPIGLEDQLKGVIDLVSMKGLFWNDESKGAEYETTDIPADLKEAAVAAREKLIEAVASVDDDLMHKYIEGEEISEKEDPRSASQGTIELKLGLSVTGSAFKNKGVQTLLDAVVDYLPSPLDVPPVEGISPKTLRLKLELQIRPLRFPDLSSRSWLISTLVSCRLCASIAERSGWFVRL